jgi:kojibiose phosphorylase
VNGIYDDAPLVSPELVNCPDWLSLVILIGDATDTVSRHRFRLDQGTILNYQRWLDLYRGVVTRRIRWRSPAGQTLDLWFERFMSLADPHVAALRCRLTPIDFAAPIEVHASLNQYADNEGIFHWNWLDQAEAEDVISLHLRTRHTQMELGMAARLTVSDAVDSMQPIGFQGCPTLIAKFEARPHHTVTLEKVVTVFTSRDTATPVVAARSKLIELPNYETLQAAHEAAWAEVWQTSDVLIEGDLTAQIAVRYNLFQLIASTPRQDDRVSIPAKTLSGFAYRGHIFWDTEIFILPFLTLSQPALARNLLNYRYHTLSGARRKAQALGFEGAMYAWESADTGDEVTPTWLPACDSKRLVRIWCGEIEQHISTDIAYAVYQYWQATGDHQWMQDYGAEILLDTAVFWGSRVEWNREKDRYEIRDVIGPDEYHDHVNNNAFTNRMVQWHLQTAIKVMTWLRESNPERAAELIQQLKLTTPRLNYWQTVVQKLWIPQNTDRNIIEQFEGFFDLEDVNLKDYEPRHKSMQVLLGIEGASERQVLKQADVIMLMYLLRASAFVDAAEGYDRTTLQANWNYYNPRTDHTYGSSLSPAIHAALACDLNSLDEAYEHFMRSALVDLTDVRGNAAEGIHGASTGGVWQAVVFGFGGLRFTPSGPVAEARLPQGWTRLKFQVQWQGKPYSFDLRSEAAMTSSHPFQQAFQPIQGVIFDLDGVLTDTSEFHYQAWQRLADEEGLVFDRHANEALRGVSRQDSLRRLLNGRSVTDEQFQAMMERKNRYYLEFIKGITPDHLLPGVSDLLAELRSEGIKIALGSASKNAVEVIERLGIASAIDAIADGNSVVHSKPAPDVFLHAAKLLGLEPTACVVVEDAESGIEAALRAGMWAIGLGPESRVGSAHLVLPNLAEAHWSDLQIQLHRQREFAAFPCLV